MIGRTYQDKKKAVLDIYDRYREYRGETMDEIDIEMLEKKITALRDGKYILAVVGEAKAGKSTLINALLGEPILPTDVLQSSCAIVEIFKSDKKYVEVKYADKHTDIIHDDPATPEVDEAFEHLRFMGAIQDRFRDIPTTLIDSYIVKGIITHGRPVPFEDLQASSKMQLGGKESLIEEYVNGRSLENIPIEFKFAYPLKYAFDEFRLVDSPGVNAVGSFQDKTTEYMQRANAVLFVISMDTPIESSSFLDFLKKNAPNHTRESLFLILSKSGNKNTIEKEEKIKHAQSLFGQEFKTDRILHVDSMLKVISDEILGFDTANTLKMHYAERKKHCDQRYHHEPCQKWRDAVVTFHTKQQLLNNIIEEVNNDDRRDVVHEELRRLSNFNRLEKMIEDFSARAPELQLAEVLDTVKLGYDNQIERLEQNIDIWVKKVKNPQTFENDIAKIQEQINNYKSTMIEFSELIRSEYLNFGSLCMGKINELTSAYCSQVEIASDINSLKKILIDYHDGYQLMIDNTAKEIKGKYVEELRRRGDELKKEYHITVPQIDIYGIETRATLKAYEITEVPREARGFWEKIQKIFTIGLKEYRETREIFSEPRFLANFKADALREIYTLRDKERELFSSLIDSFTEAFQTSMKSLIDGRLRFLEEIKVKKSKNEEMQEKIEGAKQKKKDLEETENHVNEVLENLR